VTLLSSTLSLGISRSGNSMAGFNPFDILESASTDALNFRLSSRLSGIDAGPSLGGATEPMAGFWTLRRSEGYIWGPESALLTRVEVRRAVIVVNVWLGMLVA
jgi:hypothetical protein